VEPDLLQRELLQHITNRHTLMLEPIDALCLCKGPKELKAARAAGYISLSTPLLKGDMLNHEETVVVLCYRRCRYLDVFLQAYHLNANPEAASGTTGTSDFTAPISAISDFRLLGSTSMEPRLLTKRMSIAMV
jgi:hypothetical protein